MRYAVLFLIVAVVVACATSTDSQATIHEVSLEGLSFIPSTLTIEVGDTVRWTNNSGGIIHTTTSGSGCISDGKWNSGSMSGGQTFTYSGFANAGEYPFYCIPHCGFGMTGNITVEQTATGIRDDVPTAYGAVRNYPNPFNPSTTIEYTLLRPARVEIDIFDTTGAFVNRIEDAHRPVGTHTAVWNATGAGGLGQASGVYFYRLSLDGVTVEMRKMVLLK